MYEEIHKELLNELNINNSSKNFDFRKEYTLAYDDVIENSKATSRYMVKKLIKDILIEKLQQNAEAEHKSKAGKVGAFFSSILAKILPYITIKKNEFN